MMIILATRVLPLLAFAILALLPHVVGEYARFILLMWMITSLAGVGLNLPMGLGGFYSLGHGGFMLIGAYTTALAINAGWPYPLSLAASVVVAVGSGVLVGLPALRLRHFALAIVTFAFAYTLSHVVKSFAVTGGPQGLYLPELPMQTANRGIVFYYVVLALLVLGVTAYYAIATGRSGRALRVIGASEIVARSLGIGLVRYKLMAFVFSSVLGAVAGNLQAIATSFVAPESYTAELSIFMFASVMIGGKGKLLGPFLGAAFVIGVPELTQGARAQSEIIYAVLFIGIVTMCPQGLAGLAEQVWRPVARLATARQARHV